MTLEKRSRQFPGPGSSCGHHNKTRSGNALQAFNRLKSKKRRYSKNQDKKLQFKKLKSIKLKKIWE
jgi:hypothetical protein